MEDNGWTFDVTHSMPDNKYIGNCGNATWYGYTHSALSDTHVGHSVGYVKAKFMEYGQAMLDFGNCYGGGKVDVFLNNKNTKMIMVFLSTFQIFIK